MPLRRPAPPPAVALADLRFRERACARRAGASPYSTTALDRVALHAWVMVRPGQGGRRLQRPPVQRLRRSRDPPRGSRAARGTRPPRRRRHAGLPDRRLQLVLAPRPARHAERRGRADGPRLRSTAPSRACWPMPGCATATARRIRTRPRDPGIHLHPGRAASGWSTPGRKRSRIDYVFTAGRSETLASQVVGEADGPAHRHRRLPLAVGPSRASSRRSGSCRSTRPPSSPRRRASCSRARASSVRTWDPVRSGAGRRSSSRRGGAPQDALTGVRDMPHDWQRMIPLSTIGLDARRLRRAPRRRGRRRAAALRASRSRCRARGPRSRPSLLRRGSASRSACAGAHAPGDLRDWIGLYRAGETDVSQYLGFIYTEAAFAGEAASFPTPPTDRIAAGRLRAAAAARRVLRRAREGGHRAPALNRRLRGLPAPCTSVQNRSVAADALIM